MRTTVFPVALLRKLAAQALVGDTVRILSLKNEEQCVVESYIVSSATCIPGAKKVVTGFASVEYCPLEKDHK